MANFDSDRPFTPPSAKRVLAVHQPELVQRLEEGDPRPLWRLLWFGATRARVGTKGLARLQAYLGDEMPAFLDELDKGESDSSYALELDVVGDDENAEATARGLAEACAPDCLVFAGLFENEAGEDSYLAVVAVDSGSGRLALSRVDQQGDAPRVRPPAPDEDVGKFFGLIDYLAGWVGWRPEKVRPIDD